MKGMVFTEFFEFMDDRFSYETTERIIEMSHLPSEGIYTSIGTYDHHEMVTLVSNLSNLTGLSGAELLKSFGQYLFKRFLTSFPAFFEGINSSLEFLPRVNDVVHIEVRKLYADAELPTFSCEVSQPGSMAMIYSSSRNMADLAEGLILGCIEHYGESLKVRRENLLESTPRTIFFITPKQDPKHG